MGRKVVFTVHRHTSSGNNSKPSGGCAVPVAFGVVLALLGLLIGLVGHAIAVG